MSGPGEYTKPPRSGVFFFAFETDKPGKFIAHGVRFETQVMLPEDAKDVRFPLISPDLGQRAFLLFKGHPLTEIAEQIAQVPDRFTTREEYDRLGVLLATWRARCREIVSIEKPDKFE